MPAFSVRSLLVALIACTCVLVPASSAFGAFGLVPGGFEFAALNEDGSVGTQAGSHPFQVVTKVMFNRTSSERPDGDLKDVHVDLPAGFVGNATAVPQCTEEAFQTKEPEPPGPFLNHASCPASTQVGLLDAITSVGAFGGLTFAIFNLVPPAGVPALFGANVEGVPILLTPSVRSDGDYGLTISSDNTVQALTIFGFKVTFWGVPGDPAHDAVRGNCLNTFLDAVGPGSRLCPSESGQVAFVSLPTSCSGPLTTTVRYDSWEEPTRELTEQVVSHVTGDPSQPVGLDGCNKLEFNPAVSVQPDTSQGDTPAGFTVHVRPTLGGLVDPDGVSSADIQNTRVTLPQGVVINPGQAAGLAACQASEDAVGTTGIPSCPLASKVGTVQITTPLLSDKLEGNVYVLQSNPPNLKLLVAASVDGINLKLIGNVQLDEATGQLTTTFNGTPAFPFSDIDLSFSGGPQAALMTPNVCGAYTTAADFTPWSAPLENDAFSNSTFNITSGPNGSGCPSSAPFSPSMIAGATTDQAGGYTNFSLLLQRADGQQRISTLQFKTPQGLLGMISKVPLCPEPQAAQGTCSAASQIGHTVVEAGPGPYPLVVPQPGQPPAPIYLTGGYKGAPYGLSIAVPVVAGPFNLGTVVVRSRIEVDPHTAQLTITTDPLPSILDGIPTDLRTINAVIDRAGFMFNPTNCNPQSFSGTATSTEGAQAAISSPFQVLSCRTLEFKPSFKVTTAARTSKAGGASLDAKITYPTTTPGTGQATAEANIASVKVDLPKQLPSRLTTLQKACLAKVFEANPAACPKESIVGHATAVTPVLPVSLSGPAYFVSHGGEAFPSLIVVLQGYGVTVDLVGTTFISHAGITSSTFKQVPDVPVTTFDLTLPTGKFSALAANLPAKAHGSFCGQNLVMPTAFTAQNGAVLKQNTKIAVSDCPKHKKAKGGRKKRGGK
jgi:hypothetical protein